MEVTFRQKKKGRKLIQNKQEETPEENEAYNDTKEERQTQRKKELPRVQKGNGSKEIEE